MKLLLVEDDRSLAEVLSEALTAHHYSVSAATDGLTAWELVQSYEYDLLLLDIMVPKLDGISLCRQVRTAGYQMPILLLTGKDSTSDRVIGLEAGADDYLVKPFSLPELIARIRALLRRGKTTAISSLRWDALVLNSETGEVTYQDKLLHLTPKEYGLLELFLQNPQRIFSRSALLDRIWSVGESPGEEAVTTQIKGLRQKLKAGGIKTEAIETVYGMGYRLKPAPQEDSPPPEKTKKQQAESQIKAIVAQLWEPLQKSLPDKLAVLENAIACIATGNLKVQQQQQAQSTAHKLAGTLGTFGLPECSQVMREVELILSDTTLKPSIATTLQQKVDLLKQQVQWRSSPEAFPTKASPPPGQRILVIDNDRTFAQQLQTESASWGMQVEIAENPEAAPNAIAHSSPQAILLNLEVRSSLEEGLTLLGQLKQQYPHLPILAIASQTQLSTRLKVARLGGNTFLQKPLALPLIFQALKNALIPTHSSDAKLLVVDDDPQLLEYLQALLQPWGLHITTLSETQSFWDVLETTQPDLLILDVEMPNYNGIDLCQIVRNDARWGQLPILVLSAHADAQTIYQVFSAGADDYIQKPVIGPELIARILNRIERTQMRRKLQKIQFSGE